MYLGQLQNRERGVELAQQLGQKKIVYLDQNWLSDMAKAHLDNNRRVDKLYFTELFKDIQRAISQDKIVCPSSPLHESESNLSSQWNVDIRSMDNAISRGLSFKPSEEICYGQLLEAASKFAGAESSVKPWWRIPFNRDPDLLNRDPDLPDSTFPRAESALEVFLTVQKLVDEDRRIRNEVAAPMYKQYKEVRAEQNPSYRDEVEFSRIQLFHEHFFVFDNAESVLKQACPDWDIVHSSVFQERRLRLAELEQICNRAGGIAPFLSSRDFKNTPYLSIRSKLMAADSIHHRIRKPEKSLLDDFDMAATVVPYVDVFATENYLAELLRKTGVAKDYGCNVYTMRQKSMLRDHLSQL